MKLKSLLLTLVLALSSGPAFGGVKNQLCDAFYKNNVADSLAYMDISLEFMPAPRIDKAMAIEMGRQVAEIDFNLAEKLLNRPLSNYDRLAIKEAHLIGFGEVGTDGQLARLGTYTDLQKFSKMRILRRNNFTADEARILGDNGIVGNNKIGFFTEMRLRMFGVVDVNTGEHLKVRRSGPLSNNGGTELQLVREGTSQGRKFVSEVIPIPNTNSRSRD